MGKEKRLLKVEEVKSRADIAAFLHGLADQLAGGKVTLGVGEESQTLELPDQLALEFQADAKKKKDKSDRYTLEVEIKWSQSKPAESEPVEAQTEVSQ